jgi:hypothetical protein
MCFLFPLHYGEHEILLRFFLEANIPPMTDISSQSSGFFAFREASKHIESIHFQPMAALSLEIGLPPLIEELCLDLLVDIESNQVLILVVFMHEVHSMSVPLPQRVSLSFSRVVPHHLNKLMNSFFKIFHIPGTILYFLDGVLCSLIQSLTKNLEQELGSQQSDMGFVGSDDLFSLTIHAIDVVLVPVI